jgi:uncharacterized membrane-anchored protein YhcB (DUF1043 family)
MKIKLNKKEDSRAGKVYLLVNFEGGDGDTYHLQEELIEDMTFDEEKEIELSKNAEELIKNYKKLKTVLDINYKDYLKSYKEVLEKHGETIANLYDNTPNDPQGDYQFKCYLSSICIKAYDNKGTLYESYSI